MNYNVKDYLLQCLNSIKKSKLNNEYEIIVIDNNSSEDLCEIEDSSLNIKLYQLRKNYGFAYAVNYGIRKSAGGHILLLNPDTLIKEDGTTWYLCLISIPLDRTTTMSQQIEVLPGMQATVNIVSGSKSVLQYLLQPFTDIKNKAFRER